MVYMTPTVKPGMRSQATPNKSEIDPKWIKQTFKIQYYSCIPDIHFQVPWRLDRVTYRCSMKCFSVRSASSMKNILYKMVMIALTSVAQFVGHPYTKQKVTSSIPSEGTCLGYGFSPQWGHVREATYRCFSFTSVFLSLSFSLPSPLSKKK